MTNTIPNFFSSNGQDWFNYAAHEVASNHQIQAVLIFDRHLDESKLEKAVRITIDIEPIFG